MIISKKLISSYALVEKSKLEELNWLIKQISNSIEKTYKKNVVVFEHGMCACIGGLDRAHLHLMTVKEDTSDDLIKKCIDKTLLKRKAGISSVEIAGNKLENIHDILEVMNSKDSSSYKVNGKQLFYEDIWKDLDIIVIDMPPGTGDTQLTFAQEIKVDGVIIVSTPQEIALADVTRGINMFDKLKVPILGLIDNMSFFESDEGKKYNIFGEGGVEKLSKDFNKKFLGKIPIDISLRIAADNGKPLVEEKPDHKISKIFLEIAKKIKGSFL